MASRLLTALLAAVTLSSCATPAPTTTLPSATTSGPVLSAPSVSHGEPGPTDIPTASPIAFRIDVENRSRLPVVVSLATDLEASMFGFEPGDSGTIVISLGSSENGVSLEILGPSIECGYLNQAMASTSEPFTIVLTDASVAHKLVLSLQPGVEGSTQPLPTNELTCPGG